jgi:hypothetical protein
MRSRSSDLYERPCSLVQYQKTSHRSDERLIPLYEIIFLKELYQDANLVIHAGYINQEKKAHSRSKVVSLSEGNPVWLFFQPKTPHMLFTLRTSSRYRHVLNHLFCVTTSPVGPILTLQDRKLPDHAGQKLHQWLNYELRVLGL